jgi:hypothetical protein
MGTRTDDQYLEPPLELPPPVKPCDDCDETARVLKAELDQITALYQDSLEAVTALIEERDQIEVQRRATVEVTKERIEELEAAIGELSACTCGCPMEDHENYGEDGYSCEHDDHECLSCYPAVAKMLADLRASNRLAASTARAIAGIECAEKKTHGKRVGCGFCEIEKLESKVEARGNLLRRARAELERTASYRSDDLLARLIDIELPPSEAVCMVCDQTVNVDVSERALFVERAMAAARDHDWAMAEGVYGVFLCCHDCHPVAFDQSRGGNVGFLRPERYSQAQPMAACPSCGVHEPDYDGFGILAHLKPAYLNGCGYCSHPARKDDVCELCGDIQGKPRAAKRALPGGSHDQGD